MNHEIAEYLYQHALEYASNYQSDELRWGRSIDQTTFQKLSSYQFLKQYCWVVYASGFRVSVIEKKFPALQQVFQDFDLAKLAEMTSIEPVLAVFNNRRKAQGFLDGAKQVNEEGFETFKRRVQQEGIEVLQELPGIGKITQKHLAKNIGLLDVAKDDIWLVRLATFCETEVDQLTNYLSQKFGETQHVVDLVLWRFCADSGWKKYGFDRLEIFIEDQS